MSKRIFIGLAVAALLAGAGSVNARSPKHRDNNPAAAAQVTDSVAPGARCCPGHGSAKHGRKHGERKNPQARLLKGIDLSAAQTAELNAFNQRQRTEDQQAREQRRQQRRASEDAAMKQILTPEQYAVYQANVKVRDEHRAEMRQQRGQNGSDVQGQGRRHRDRKEGRDGCRRHGHDYGHGHAAPRGEQPAPAAPSK